MNIHFIDESANHSFKRVKQGLKSHFLPNISAHIELFGIHLRHVDKEWMYPLHDHPMFEMNLVLEGRQSFTIGNHNFLQEEGDLLIIPPGTAHSSQSADKMEFVYFCLHFIVQDTLLTPLLNQSEQMIFKSDSIMARLTRPILMQLVNLCKQSRPVSITERMTVSSMMFSLVGTILDCLTEQEDQEAKETAFLIAEKINEVIRGYKHGNLIKGDRIWIHDIAEELGISTSYCNLLFRKVYSISPRQYLSVQTLNKAKSLLLQPDYSMEEISYLLGYHDVAHFSRQFKRWSGLTPSQYRKLQVGSPKK